MNQGLRLYSYGRPKSNAFTFFNDYDDYLFEPFSEGKQVLIYFPHTIIEKPKIGITDPVYSLNAKICQQLPKPRPSYFATPAGPTPTPTPGFGSTGTGYMSIFGSSYGDYGSSSMGSYGSSYMGSYGSAIVDSDGFASLFSGDW